MAERRAHAAAEARWGQQRAQLTVAQHEEAAQLASADWVRSRFRGSPDLRRLFWLLGLPLRVRAGMALEPTKVTRNLQVTWIVGEAPVVKNESSGLHGYTL
jgi:hypothetical protein